MEVYAWILLSAQRELTTRAVDPTDAVVCLVVLC